MRKILFVLGIFGSTALQAAMPVFQVSSARMTQPFGTRETTITYTLTNAPVIVTLDIQTNVTGRATDSEADWISVGDGCFRDVTGDVNRMVETTGAKTIHWNPEIHFTGVEARRGSCRAVVNAWAPSAPPDYMTVDLRRDKDRTAEAAAAEPRIRYYTSTNALPDADGVAADRYREGFMLMRCIRAQGETFTMGSPTTESGRAAAYELQRDVTFTNADFYIGVFPLTYGQALNVGYQSKGDPYGCIDIHLDSVSGNVGYLYQYQSVGSDDMATNHFPLGCGWSGVRSLGQSGYDWPLNGHSVASLSLIGQLRTRTGIAFDLPTEAQWEYCCRAGTAGATWLAVQSSQQGGKDVGWIDANSSKKVRSVGLKPANPWGLYDMLGNHFELCLDYYAEITDASHVWEATGPTTGTKRAIRGGSYSYSYNWARAAARLNAGASTAVETTTGARLIAPVGLVWPTGADLHSLSVTYDLTSDQIVTCDVQTNRTGAATADEDDWVSIGSQYLRNVRGDVNRKVTAGTGKRVYWRADEVWPNHRVAENAIRMVVRKWDTDNPPDYMVVSLVVSNSVAYYPNEAALPGGIGDDRYRCDSIVMRRIPSQGVRWCMGAPTNEIGRMSAETQHYVTFTNADFYMAVFPLTVGQYAPFESKMFSKMWQYGYNYQGTGISGNNYAGDNWKNAPATAQWDVLRNGKTGDTEHVWPTNGHAVGDKGLLGLWRGLTGVDFDLPTDAQWEYACRAGVGTALNNGSNLSSQSTANGASDIAWYDGNSSVNGSRKCHPVGTKKANNWGLYDMHGTMAELCLDYYQDDLTAADAVEPIGPRTGSSGRVQRGGCYSYAISYARSASRISSYQGTVLGCRFVCPISLKWPNGGRVLPEE